MHIPRLIIISSVVILLDQATKYLVMKGMVLGQSIPVVEGLLSLTYVMNPGAAFGFLASASQDFRVPFFLGVSVVAIGVVLFFYFRAAQESVLLQVGLCLVLGGAVGNLIDRLRFQEVVDFIDLYYGMYHWPAFNVADSAISIGVGALILDMFFAIRQEKKETR